MTVSEIKAKYDRLAELEETALLRAVAPAARRRQEERRRLEALARRENARLTRTGARLRVL